MEAPPGINGAIRPYFDPEVLPTQDNAQSPALKVLKRKNEEAPPQLEGTRVRRIEKIDRQKVIQDISSIVEKPLDLDHLTDEELQKRAQKAYLTIDEPLFECEFTRFIFEDLKSPYLIPEAEKRILKPFLENKNNQYTLALFKLLLAGKAPSYGEGAAALAEFLGKVQTNGDQLNRSIYGALDELDLEMRLEIFKKFHVYSTRASELFNHYFKTALDNDPSEPIKRILRTFAAAQPWQCAALVGGMFWQRTDEFRFECLVTVLETWATLPSPSSCSQGLELLSKRSITHQWMGHPAIVPHLLKIFEQVSCANLDGWQYQQFLVTILSMGSGGSPDLPEEAIIHLKRLLAVPIQLGSLEYVFEHMNLIENLIKFACFLQIWPLLQKQLLQIATQGNNPATLAQSFYIKAAYRHSQATLSAEATPLIVQWSTQIQSEIQTEHQLYALAIITHYAPHLLPVHTPFQLQEFSPSNPAVYLKCLALIPKDRFSEGSWAVFAKIYKRIGFSTDQYQVFFEVSLRLNLRLEVASINYSLRSIARLHSVSPYTIDSLLVVLETLARKVQEGKVAGPFENLEMLVEQLPPSERLFLALSGLVQNKILP